MKITLQHIAFWHAMQRQPSWAIKYKEDRQKRWPSMSVHEKKRDRLIIHRLIPLDHTSDKGFHIQNLMALLSYHRAGRGMLIEKLSEYSINHQEEQERRLCKKWLKRIMDWKEKTIINFDI